ncbi:MAG: acyl carrier protein [Clostridia bacterium]|nr:acyl carrier protein [Clostridia bacterium]
MVFDKVVKVVIEQLDLDGDIEITPQTSLMHDLEADSLDAVEVIMALEDQFSIEIPDEDAEGFKSIGDIAKYIEEKTK